ncbi:hypothetical protein FS837_011942 [Tulasnella sp. UAMH 9824]|nr:hypothetical protein FS837_011942 [Tulasnella sp. UAMH 9824]
MPLLSLNIIQRGPPNILAAWLGYLADSTNGYPSQARHSALGFIIDELVNPSWRCISMAIVAITAVWGVKKSDHEMLRAAYAGKPSVVLQNLAFVIAKSNDPDCQDRDTLRKYLVKILNFTGKAAIDSSTNSSGGPNGVAGVLRFLERLMRAQDSSSDLINIGRNLRGELTSALARTCEKPPSVRSEYPGSALEEMLEESLQLFRDLTASLKPPALNSEFCLGNNVEVAPHRSPYLATVGGRPTTSSNEDDVELASLFSPVLQRLNVLANTMMDNWFGFSQPEHNRKFKRQVTELNGMFAVFQDAVRSVSRDIKIRKRDPDLGWCYYDGESELHTRLVGEASAPFASHDPVTRI